MARDKCSPIQGATAAEEHCAGIHREVPPSVVVAPICAAAGRAGALRGGNLVALGAREPTGRGEVRLTGLVRRAADIELAAEKPSALPPGHRILRVRLQQLAQR
jgi:hypothetical protein